MIASPAVQSSLATHALSATSRGFNEATTHSAEYYLREARQYLGLHPKNGTRRIPRSSDASQAHDQPVILVAFDTEGGERALTEVGIAMLDTRHILHTTPGISAHRWSEHIRTHHFHIYPPNLPPKGRRAGRVRRVLSFGFGKTQKLPLAALKPYVESLIDPARNHVLVGHSIAGDLQKLHRFGGLDLRSMPCVTDQLDTWLMVRETAMVPHGLGKLWRYLRWLDEPLSAASLPCAFTTGAPAQQRGANFHNAGNDAFYNIQVLLMLALRPQPKWVEPTRLTLMSAHDSFNRSMAGASPADGTKSPPHLRPKNTYWDTPMVVAVTVAVLGSTIAAVSAGA